MTKRVYQGSWKSTRWLKHAVEKIYTHTHTHTHSHTLTHTHTHTHTLTHTQTHTLTHKHTHSLTHTHTLTHTHSLTQTHTLTHALTLTHTHTHTAGRLHKPTAQLAENPALQNKLVSSRVTRTVTPVHRLSLSTPSSANFHALTSLAVPKKPLNLQKKKCFRYNRSVFRTTCIIDVAPINIERGILHTRER
jgi:hypothetical protein